MPLLTIHTNAEVSPASIQPMLKECSAKLAMLTGKPEAYVMTSFQQGVMTMAGTGEPACLLEIRSIGKLTSKQTESLSAAFCALMEQHLKVSGQRVYINFTDFAGSMWGFHGGTFG